MELNVENVEKAIHQFYGRGDFASSSLQEVHQWLMHAQCSPQAWSFAWELLSSDKTVDVQFFGASCLHHKISKFWHEVPEDQVDALKTQLLEQIVSHALGPRMITTRLCVALSALALHAMPDKWPSPVETIISAFQEENFHHLQPNQVRYLLLELLTVLPEEFFTSHLNQQRKAAIRNELRKAETTVLPFLQNLLSQYAHANLETAPLYEQCLRCFSSWVQDVGLPLPDSETLVLQVFEALGKETFFETAVDALINVFCHPENHKYPQVMKRFLSQILQLVPMLHEAKQNMDADICQGICKLAVTSVDHNTKLLLTCTLGSDPVQQQMAGNLVNLILQCTAMPGFYPVDECCSDIPFGFWYAFQDEIINCDKDDYVRLVQIYHPVYMSLIDILLLKSQYPQESEYASWNAEEKEAHRCYRQDIGDSLMYAYNLLHENLLCHLCTRFAALIEKMRMSSAEQVRWQELEALLFAVTSIAESVSIEEDQFLPSIFTLLSVIPCNHVQVVTQGLNLIGSYAEWISAHPQVLSSALPLLLQGLGDATLAQPATLSLKEVVRENQDHMQPFVNDILTASKTALDSGVLKARDSVRLMACLGYVLSVLPTKDIMAYLNVLLAPHVEFLQQLANMEPSASSKAQIQLRLNMFCWLFGSLNTDRESESESETPAKDDGPHPVLLILQQVLPTMHAILVKWIHDASIIEDFCEMMKRALRTLMHHYSPLVLTLSELITAAFSAVPHPVLLELARQVLLLFASDPQHHPVCQSVFLALCQKSLTVIESGGIRDNSDLVEAFLGLLSQMAKKCKFLFINENCNVLGLFQAAVMGLNVPETHTIKAACQFLSDLTNLVDSSPNVKEVLTNHGHSAVDGILRVIGGDSPRPAVEFTADLLLAFNRHLFPQFCQWMNAVVAQNGFPKPWATKEQKEHFARQVLMERANKRKLKETVNEYTLVWRGMIGTEYAAQTMPSSLLGY